jgi:hypothetical protein
MPEAPISKVAPEKQDKQDGDGRPTDLLWFLSQPDALVRRLLLRTVLEPPVAMRRWRARRPAR